MKNLKDLICDFDYKVVYGEVDKEYSMMVTDSRRISKDCVFVCIKGANFDGHSAAGDAIKAGAAAVIVQDDIEGFTEGDAADAKKDKGATTIIKVDDTRYAMALMACAYNDYPAGKIKTIGITGTKGKTTTTYLIKSILEGAGHKVGLIGTIEVIIGDEHIKANNTTPESTLIQEYLRRMVDAGCDAVVMEVSSQGLMLHRTAGINFDIGIFTNLEADHIGPNEHTSFEHYLQCKSMLFRQCKVGIVNGDDKHVDAVLKNSTCRVVRYGLAENHSCDGTDTAQGKLDVAALDLSLYRKEGALGVSFDTTVYNEKLIVGAPCTFKADINMPGKFSVYNALSAICVCLEMNTDTQTIQKSLLKGFVKGRIEMLKVSPDYTLMIDYAHNAMALESLLTTLREYNPGRLVCLFGCGGNRAKARRFEMGEVSGKLADFTIITSDNPRNEDPMDIIADIKTGFLKTKGEYVEIPDRKEAIKYAIEHGQKGDIIVLAGKGHEDYQEICGVKHHMDERELVAEVMKELGV